MKEVSENNMTDPAKEQMLTASAATEGEAALVMAVAARLAELRARRGMSFDALSREAGVSKGTLVKIEQGRANPSISTLCRLASAFGVSVAEIVAPPATEGREVFVIGATQARTLWTGPSGGTAVLIAGTSGPDMLELWHWTLLPGECFTADTHGPGTREIVTVLEGEICFEVDGSTKQVSAGSSALASTDRPHAYKNAGQVPAVFMMVVHEPSRRG